ncbi:2,4'-dihydroxyacetophenone dioxygenase family protein [Acinetobacter modestus]|uniref:2,4'-dihydroxyacetophenone dioxygenase family protein n=1 Tax=Acinetobacter modestus TaxID=1776740 RepID=UPI00320B2EFC
MDYCNKKHTAEEYVKISDNNYVPFPEAFSEGGITWQLLHSSPETSSWTAIFNCPAGSSFASHIHAGPGEYFLTKGKMEVRGGEQEGGSTAYAPSYGFESSGALHGKTFFPVESQFYMTFLGPLNFIDENGKVIASIGWAEAQGAWLADKVEAV